MARRQKTLALRNRKGSRRRCTFSLPPVAVETDPLLSAKAAGLRHVRDDDPGIRRVRSGNGFRYVDPKGKTIRDQETLLRIRHLVIPPAWERVWICLLQNGHLQATGHDARGRKQYRYHPRWREVRDETKYHKMLAFAQALPRIRERVEHDLALPGLPREKILATVVRLLETTLIRVGNEEYAQENNSFGLTTLRDQHADVEGSTVHFHFRGKSGIRRDVDLHDPRLARIVKRSQDLPGAELFQYVDEEGKPHAIDSGDVNAYLHEIAGEEFTAKDFRTWAGTVLAARALQEFESYDSKTQAKHNIVAAIENVAKRLGNTRAVCRKCYIHPEVLNAYLEGSLRETLHQRVEAELREKLHRLSSEEAAVLAFLHERLKKESSQPIPA